ncbi:SH3-like domain-containing protein [uncultured Tateyamaria sp.]|uniref:SH3-like domain-containing protein n=1 Tax=uncultured Tateyamaria sp. TaxID=455651 RepID=UPI002628E8FD|nr:SH3-like domain-containing protein [uncultured Tateyamaria sp.]
MTRFREGDQVCVLALGKGGHVRIPHYIRTQTGEVVEYGGTYLNPEDLAVGNTGGKAVDLYRVAFAQTALWPDEAHAAHDRLIIEIYDHWLAPSKDRSNAS